VLINVIMDDVNVNLANEDKPGQVLLNQVVVSNGIVDNVNVVNEDNPGHVLRNQVVVLSNVNTVYIENVDVKVVTNKTEPVCAREMKDNVGVMAVLAMHSGNVNKNSERMCDRKVTRNVNNVVLAVLAMNKNIEWMCACEMMKTGT
jgi:hypothetical protein